MSGGFADYQAAVDYLFAMVDYEKITKYKYDMPTFDLSRTEKLLEAVGAPHKRLRCIHVAGTKGKGSTANIIRAILGGMGLRVGLFTSPHLVYLEERITIDGAMIPRERVRMLTERLRPYVDAVRRDKPDESPTFFELITALGFLHFAEEQVDFAVIEVGMGGRLDSTNVITPEVSVITHIDYDHVRRLGPTLEKIAREKAGIIKPGVPVASSAQAAGPRDVIAAAAAERGAQLFMLGREARVTEAASFLDEHGGGVRFRYEGLNRVYPRLEAPLIGRHQAENAGTALLALEVLERRGRLRLEAEKTAAALARASFAGRIEVFPGRPLVILDGGHNPAAARVLRAALRENLAGRRLLLVLGIASDKDMEGILREIAPAADELLITRSNSPRAAAPATLAEMAGALTDASIRCFEAAHEALAAARAAAGPDDVICVTGSLYLAGLLRPTLAPKDYEAIPPLAGAS